MTVWRATLLAIVALPSRLQRAHRSHGIKSPTSRGPVQDSNRPDLDLAAIELEVVVGLVVDDFAQIEGDFR